MRRPSPWRAASRAWLPAGLLLAAGAIGWGPGVIRPGPLVLLGYGRSGAASSATTSSGVGRAAFSIAGHAGGLYPGRTASMVLTLTNNQRFALDVTSVTALVGNASALCTSANVSVGTFSGNLTVAAGGSTQIAVTVNMAAAAPDACQGVIFPFSYGGQAVRA